MRLAIGLVLFAGVARSQPGGTGNGWTEFEKFCVEQDEFYRNKATSPLKKDERKKFHGHRFWPFSTDYIVNARFEIIGKIDTVVMPTSAGTSKLYQPYALLHFEMAGEACVLTAYQSLKLRDSSEFKNYLFLPFRDATSGSESYGGGRYLDLTIPESDTILLNFNYAYNPYCAYTTGWFCAIPPVNNTLKVRICAGLMAPSEH